jgi:hypothetical protein
MNEASPDPAFLADPLTVVVHLAFAFDIGDEINPGGTEKPTQCKTIGPAAGPPPAWRTRFWSSSRCLDP